MESCWFSTSSALLFLFVSFGLLTKLDLQLNHWQRQLEFLVRSCCYGPITLEVYLWWKDATEWKDNQLLSEKVRSAENDSRNRTQANAQISTTDQLVYFAWRCGLFGRCGAVWAFRGAPGLQAKAEQ